MKMLRTTLRLQEGLYVQTKRLAVEAHKTVQDILNEALASYLPLLQKTIKGRSSGGTKFKTHHLGGYAGGHRRDLYEDR